MPPTLRLASIASHASVARVARLAPQPHPARGRPRGAVFAVLGFLSPANRGGLMTAMLLLFVFMGVPAGYSSAFLHKSLKGTDWKKNIVLTSWYCAQF